MGFCLSPYLCSIVFLDCYSSLRISTLKQYFHHASDDEKKKKIACRSMWCVWTLNIAFWISIQWNSLKYLQLDMDVLWSIYGIYEYLNQVFQKYICTLLCMRQWWVCDKWDVDCMPHWVKLNLPAWEIKIERIKIHSKLMFLLCLWVHHHVHIFFTYTHVYAIC